MKISIFYIAVLTFLSLSMTQAQSETGYLTKLDIQQDLAFLDDLLQDTSSYQGLNKYNYKKDFNAFLENIKTDSVSEFEFGLFLSKTIGKIGDRHSFIKGYNSRDSLYFPIAFAPFEDKVVVLDYDRETKKYGFLNPEFPYLKSINKISIEKILPQILPGEVCAPKQSYFTYAVRDLRDIQTIFKNMNIELPNPISITLANKKGVDTTLNIKLVSGRERARLWDERFYRKTFRIKDEQYNDKTYVERFFKLESQIAYIQIPDMADKEDSPVFFDALNVFMLKAKNSNALIIDVRDNGGGTRHLIQELAGYFIHSDSVYVVNTVKQRGELPLNDELKEELHSRYLFAKDELNEEEQIAVDEFMDAFKPMYDLNHKQFSEYYYYVLNGKKLSKTKYFYNKPIYILANERSFSAASVLVSVFKGLPNVAIVGVNTDGSSGNSRRFELPNSGFRGKISTMVSFQKNGNVLDGIGTKPDILIERNLDQIFYKEDYQLKKLKDLINQE